MANRLLTNPMIIDTTDATIPGPLTIQAIAWIGGGEAGKDIAVADRLRIKIRNTGGGVVLDVKAQFVNDADDGTSQVGFQQSFPRDWKVADGLYVDDIDGGELYIWV